VLGTAALKDRRLLRAVLQTWGPRIVVGIDARDGYVATDGWREDSQVLATELAREVVALGARHIIYTDIARDGALDGPNLMALRQMIEAVGVPVIASGGVGTLDDLRRLRDAGAAGAIVGRALYKGTIDLPDAIAEVQHADEARDPLP
jgi:phosphoribosylformimino-5-aminoimidazole carboxamide ribotide isomerase